MEEFTTENLVVEMRGHIALLRLNRPEKRNAIRMSLIEDINRIFSAPPEGTRAVVLSGAGDHFCAGLDLSEHKERNVAESLAVSRYWHRTLDMVQFGGLPVVTAMHGAVMGGGLEIAAATHVRVAEPSVIYQLPEGQRGIFVGGGASVRVSRIIGPGRMTEMMLTGRRLNGEEGQALGLSHYSVGPGEAVTKALALAESIAQNAALVNDVIMLGIERIADMSMTEGLYTETIASALTQTSEDAKAGMEAFLEKRKPKFRDD